MTKYILHGGFARVDNEHNRDFYREIVKDLPKRATILLVFFASRSDDNAEKVIQVVNLFARSTNAELNYTYANQEDFLSQITEVDAVYIHGGDTQKLIKILSQYDGVGEAFDGKTIAGSSAGTYALSTLYSSHYEDIVEHGLGLVPVRAVSHYESSKLSPKSGAVELLKNTKAELELVLLRDHAWKTFRVQ